MRAREKTLLSEYHDKLADLSNAEVAYRSRYGLEWITFAERITEAVTREVPVTVDLVPRLLRKNWRDQLNFYEAGRAPEKPDVSRDTWYASLRQLHEVLTASSDEEISTYSLTKMGFPLGKILR